MLPGIDGVEVCRRLRESGVWSPVLMLTARDAVEDRVAGLDAGADDYLPKPFSFAELLARLRALARRGAVERPAVLEVGDLRLDPATRAGLARARPRSDLSAKEFALLETFMRRPGQVLSRYELLEHAWDYGYENRSNVVDVYVRYLRDKIDRPFGRESLETVRGAGYRLRDGRRAVSRLPIRLRLTLAFALAMAIVLAAIGALRLPPARRLARTSSSTTSLELARRRARGARPRRGTERRRRLSPGDDEELRAGARRRTGRSVAAARAVARRAARRRRPSSGGARARELLVAPRRRGRGRRGAARVLARAGRDGGATLVVVVGAVARGPRGGARRPAHAAR